MRDSTRFWYFLRLVTLAIIFALFALFLYLVVLLFYYALSSCRVETRFIYSRTSFIHFYWYISLF